MLWAKNSMLLFLDYWSFGNQSQLLSYIVCEKMLFLLSFSNQLYGSLSAVNSIITSFDSAIFNIFWHVCQWHLMSLYKTK